MPNNMPGTGRYVQTPLAIPTAGVGVVPTWRGSAMQPITVTDLLPGASFNAQGRGHFSLTTATRFPRGARLSGRQGTMDLFVKVGEQGETPATGVLTSTAVGLTNTETVTVDGKVYTFEDVLTNSNGNVKVGADAAETLFNLLSAINLSGGVGTRYATATTLHPTVEAAGGPGLTMIATAKTPGLGGNVLATTETSAEASWGAVTLTGGTSTACTLCFLTDVPENPQQAIVLGLDSFNRPTLKLAILPSAGAATFAVGVLTLTGNVTDVAATATLTSSGQVNDGDTVEIDGKTYTYKAILSDTDGFVKIGVTQALSMENLRRAINLDGVAGTNYALSTTLHPTVSATDTATTVDITAKANGTEANAIILAENSVELDWDNATMTGGLNETITIGSKIYRFQSTLTNVDGNVHIGASTSDSIDNLIAAIMLGAGGGVDYAAVMTEHPTVTATAGAGDTMDTLAKTVGAAGNAIATTETSANASWGAATLTGGSGGPLTVGEVTPSGVALPDNGMLRIRMAWDSLVPIPGGGGGRHMTLRVNGELIDPVDWSTDPTAPWVHFQPTHIVLGECFDGSSDFDGEVRTWQGSEVVTP